MQIATTPLLLTSRKKIQRCDDRLIGPVTMVPLSKESDEQLLQEKQEKFFSIEFFRSTFSPYSLRKGTLRDTLVILWSFLGQPSTPQKCTRYQNDRLIKTITMVPLREGSDYQLLRKIKKSKKLHSRSGLPAGFQGWRSAKKWPARENRPAG